LTLGYGNRSVDDAVSLLEHYGIKFLIDIRSIPKSRFHPDFSQDALINHMRKRDIAYLPLGNELGGRPNDPGCYDEKGRVDYEACRRRPVFQEGIGRLQAAWEQGRRVTLLCSESRPQDCHRSKLVGVALEAAGIEVMHVDEDSVLVSQQEVMERVYAGQLPLFGDFTLGRAARSRRSYRSGHE
jgi:uncharacterized protein (DUF488 family)